MATAIDEALATCNRDDLYLVACAFTAFVEGRLQRPQWCTRTLCHELMKHRYKVHPVVLRETVMKAQSYLNCKKLKIEDLLDGDELVFWNETLAISE